MTSTDLAFPYRLRYAADVLREVDAYRNYPDGEDTYEAAQLVELADEYEANTRHHIAELEELAALIRNQYELLEVWWCENLAKTILDAGWRRAASTELGQ